MNTKQAPRLAFSFLEAGLACAFIAAFFFVPQAHFGFSTRILDFGDEGLLWYVSQRTALGEIPLRDFFSYDPGRYYWSAFVFKLAGKDGLLQQIVADQLFGLIGVFVTYFAMCRLEIDRRWRVVIALLIGVAMGFPRHKIYEQTLSLISALAVTAVLCKPSPKRWFCFGIITGGAAFIGRNSGAYFTIAALLTLIIVHFLSELPSAGISGGKALAYFGGGVVLGYLPMLLMLVLVPGFPAAVRQSILINFKQLIPVAFPFPWRLHELGLAGAQPFAMSILFLAAPLTYVFVLARLPWDRSHYSALGERHLSYGAALAGIPFLAHAFSYARFGHIAQATLPFILATGAASAYFYKAGKRVISVCALISLVALVLACWLPREPAIEYLRARDHYKPLQIQGQQFWMISGDANLMEASRAAYQRCGSRDGSFLASPDYPSLYAFLRTRSPFWEVYFIMFRLPSSPEAQQRHIDALVQNKTSVILLSESDEKAMSSLYPELLRYIRTHYRPLPAEVPLGDNQIYYAPASCGD